MLKNAQLRTNDLPTWEELGFAKKPVFKEWAKPESKAHENASLMTFLVLTRIQEKSKKT